MIWINFRFLCNICKKNLQRFRKIVSILDEYLATNGTRRNPIIFSHCKKRKLKKRVGGGSLDQRVDRYGDPIVVSKGLEREDEYSV